MDEKNNHIARSSAKKILRALPLLGIVTCLFIILIGLLLSIGRMDKTVPASGIFEPYPKIEIKATIKDTVVDDILVEVGEEVKKGQVLVRLKDQEQSEERISQLKERLKLADINLERLRQLFDDGYVAKRDREEAELEMKILAQDLSALQKRAKALVIVAPFAGTVVGIPVKVGDAVYMGQELVLMAASQERALRMWIKEEDSSEVKLAQEVKIYSQIFYYRRHGVALGKIVEIDSYPKVRDGENHVETLVQIRESPFPIRIGSRAEARIVIKRCPILKLLFGLER